MTTDIEIARAAKPQNINKIAEKLGLGENDIETYDVTDTGMLINTEENGTEILEKS